jgi:hypothetical protein
MRLSFFGKKYWKWRIGFRLLRLRHRLFVDAVAFGIDSVETVGDPIVADIAALEHAILEGANDVEVVPASRTSTASAMRCTSGSELS